MGRDRKAEIVEASHEHIEGRGEWEEKGQKRVRELEREEGPSSLFYTESGIPSVAR